MRVLVLGATGMLGSSVMQIMSENLTFSVVGTIQSSRDRDLFKAEFRDRLIVAGDLLCSESIGSLLENINPDIVINCVGVVKQLASASDPMVVVPINSLFPHQVARLCQKLSIRMIHVSTDCVFSGNGDGNYVESDTSDATDLYGKSKYIGEVTYPNAITLRTSIIGHEIRNAHGLVEWFLSQTNSCQGYSKFIFSGLPAIELAKIIRDEVVPREEMQGLYHVASKPISKFSLLNLLAEVYEKNIEIVPNDTVKINRALNPSLFRNATGYTSKNWLEMLREMKDYRGKIANV